jgi:5-methyltetrahydrofolate--homocysteine methyltransferase
VSEFPLIAEGVIAGKADVVDQLVRAALEGGASAERVLEQGLIAGMSVVGKRFRENEIFVPEVLLAARAMRAGLAHLEPVFAACGVPSAGTCVIGTVQGDIHDIGKNLVGVMLRGAGFKVVDLGINVPAAKFVAAAREHSPDIVALSALLTTTMIRMKDVIAALRAEGFGCPVMVGGAAVNADFARQAGADAYGANASEAVEHALRLVGGAPAGAARS